MQGLPGDAPCLAPPPLRDVARGAARRWCRLNSIRRRTSAGRSRSGYSGPDYSGPDGPAGDVVQAVGAPAAPWIPPSRTVSGIRAMPAGHGPVADHEAAPRHDPARDLGLPVLPALGAGGHARGPGAGAWPVAPWHGNACAEGRLGAAIGGGRDRQGAVRAPPPRAASRTQSLPAAATLAVQARLDAVLPGGGQGFSPGAARGDAAGRRSRRPGHHAHGPGSSCGADPDRLGRALRVGKRSRHGGWREGRQRQDAGFEEAAFGGAPRRPHVFILPPGPPLTG